MTRNKWDTYSGLELLFDETQARQFWIWRSLVILLSLAKVCVGPAAPRRWRGGKLKKRSILSRFSWGRVHTSTPKLHLNGMSTPISPRAGLSSIRGWIIFKREDLLKSSERNAVTGHHIQADHWWQKVLKTLFEFRSMWFESKKSQCAKGAKTWALPGSPSELHWPMTWSFTPTESKWNKSWQKLIMHKRVELCEWITDMTEDVPGPLTDSWFSGEAHFYLSGYVNWKNNVYWWNQPPDITYITFYRRIMPLARWFTFLR